MLNKEDSIDRENRKSKSGSTYSVYHFKCLNCENIVKAQIHQLKTHSGKCRRCTQLGVPYLHIYNELRNHHNKSVNFDLSFDDFLELIKVNSCHYCGDDIIFNKHSKFMNVGLSRAYQLDRKNNDIGYIKDNLVVTCWNCNKLKSDKFTYEEFLKLSPILKEIINNRKKIT